MPVQSLGRNPKGQDLKKIEALPNYRNGAFQNIEVITAPDSFRSTTARPPQWTRLLRFFVSRKPANTRPPQRVPFYYTDLKRSSYQKPTVVWFGHSSFLLKTAKANILVDPVFSGYAGPLMGLVNAFKGASSYGVPDMPDTIHALVISHDHYDHLDYTTVKRLKSRIKRVIVPIGVGSHFRKWGFDAAMITELNWHESVVLMDGLTITATPAHHRSNRGFAQRKTLWASYVFAADGFKLYFSGDTGYSKHFKLIGEQYGPFDLAMMECGQYNSKWSQSHMFPEQTAKAAVDLKSAVTIPVHWGKFAESEHPWNESVKRLTAAADSLKLKVVIPFMGQPYTIGEEMVEVKWWE